MPFLSDRQMQHIGPLTSSLCSAYAMHTEQALEGAVQACSNSDTTQVFNCSRDLTVAGTLL